MHKIRAVVYNPHRRLHHADKAPTRIAFHKHWWSQTSNHQLRVRKDILPQVPVNVDLNLPDFPVRKYWADVHVKCGSKPCQTLYVMDQCGILWILCPQFNV
jgi:hypothetical protein